MEQKENPGFYAVIPATVRYDKNVCSGAKLLYGELTALTKKEGYCYASNKYFADLYGVDAGTISRWVSKLRECGYISVEVTDRVHRKIWILENKVPQKSAEDTQKKASGATKTPIQDTQKRLDINTDIITNNNKESAPAKFKEVIKAKDPLFPECQMSDGEMVMTVIQEFLDEHWNRMAVDRHSLRDCQDIFDKLREEDKVAQLKRCLILHTYGTIDGQKKTYWSKTPPQPKFLLKNWNDIYSAKIPIWFERGFTSQAEYEADIIKTQPSSHSGMDDLKRQFFSGPMVSQERADQFMVELDELKEKINGKT
jgi:hypothetical protein